MICTFWHHQRHYYNYTIHIIISNFKWTIKTIITLFQFILINHSNDYLSPMVIGEITFWLFLWTLAGWGWFHKLYTMMNNLHFSLFLYWSFSNFRFYRFQRVLLSSLIFWFDPLSSVISFLIIITSDSSWSLAPLIFCLHPYRFHRSTAVSHICIYSLDIERKFDHFGR